MNVYVINLLRATDRKVRVTELMLGADVPKDKLILWQAVDNLDYAKNSDILKAGIADGFPFFQNWLDNGDHLHANIGLIALIWSQLRVCRHAQDRHPDEPFLLFADDWCLSTPYASLFELVAEAEHISNGQWKCISTIKSDKTEPLPPNYLLKQGANYSSDTGLILTQRGIQWFYETFEKGYVYLEDVLHDTTDPYIYSSAVDCSGNYLGPIKKSFIHDLKNPDATKLRRDNLG